MEQLTQEQAVTLFHLGIERWVVRPWPLQAKAVPLWIVHEGAALSGKALRLLTNMMRSIQLSPTQIRVLATEELAFLLPSVEVPRAILTLGKVTHPLPVTELTVNSVGLSYLLAHPADKKSVYLDLLRIQHLLLT